MKTNELWRQWDNAAEAWSEFVRAGKDCHRDELNNPTMFELLGDIRGREIMDLGCGEGYNSRIMASRGARVVGIDFSRKMIDLAIRYEKKYKLGIQYHVLDACNLHIFKNETFEIVASFMALQDIENHQRAIKEVSRVLRRYGRFVFVIPHPCFETKKTRDQVVGGWEFLKQVGGKSRTKALYCRLDRYFDTYRYKLQWTMERLTEHFETTSFHRTLTGYADALNKAELVISRLKEPRPTIKATKKYDIMKEHLRIPQSIVIEALKL